MSSLYRVRVTIVQGERLLVVSYASAPGLPNWGGLLRKVYEGMSEPAHQCFDTLYVVDPSRSWYHGQCFPLHAARHSALFRPHVLLLLQHQTCTAFLSSARAYPQGDRADSILRSG